MDSGGDRDVREADFWGHHLPTVEESLLEHERGPDPNTRAMLDLLEPLDGAQVLDFACGTGVTSAWLAARGARVTGLDITPESIERARVLCTKVGVDATFVCGALEDVVHELPTFDREFGRYALHHVDLPVYAPLLAGCLRPGGTGAFLETMYTNPAMKLARRFLRGRFGVIQWGTADETPIGRPQLQLLQRAFGSLDLELEQMRFFRLVDDNILRERRPAVTKGLRAVDDTLQRSRRLHWLSYDRIIVVRRPS